MIEWLNRIYAAMLLDLIEFFRYRMAVVSTALTSLVMILAFGLGMGKSNYMVEGIPYVYFIIPGILAVGTMFSCIYSAGYTIILDRQRKLIDDIILSPASYSSFIIGRILSNMIKSSIQLIIVLFIAVVFLKMPIPNFFIFGIAFVLTVILFAAIGMTLASFTDILSFAGFANLITLPFMYFCGVFFPVTYFKGLASIIQLAPFTAAIEVFRYAFTKQVLVGNLFSNLFILLFWSMLMGFIAVIAFKKAVSRN